MADPDGRDRILAAAGRLFYLHGVRAVGMAQVIEAAGCGKNMLYRHFPSKSDLAAAYLEDARAERDRHSAPTKDPNVDKSQQLVAIVEEVAAWVQTTGYRGCAFRNYLTEFPATDDAPARAARAYLEDTRREVDDLAADPVIADRIWLLIDGLYANTGTDPEVAVDWARELVDTR